MTHLPEFAVEFDAFGHDRPRQIERDIIKNRLCARAGFPLLRIGVDESRQLEQVSILEWLVRAFVDFETTADALDDELDDDDDDDSDLEDSLGELPDPDLSGSASDYVIGEDGPAFDEEHPLPANASIAARLLRRFGINVGDQVEGYEGGSGSAPYALDAGWPGRQPDRFEVGHASEFVVNERDVRVLTRSLPIRVVFECVGRARFAWALKTAMDRPPTSHPESREEFNRRLSPLGLDFLDPLGAARQLALYDALSQVERWAGHKPGAGRQGSDELTAPEFLRAEGRMSLRPAQLRA